MRSPVYIGHKTVRIFHGNVGMPFRWANKMHSVVFDEPNVPLKVLPLDGLNCALIYEPLNLVRIKDPKLKSLMQSSERTRLVGNSFKLSHRVTDHLGVFRKDDEIVLAGDGRCISAWGPQAYQVYMEHLSKQDRSEFFRYLGV